MSKKIISFLLLFIEILQITAQYSVYKDFGVNQQTNLISSFSANSKFKCLSECEKNLGCLSCSFLNGNCKLFTKLIESNEKSPKIGSYIYNSFKIVTSTLITADLTTLFQSPTIQNTITGYNSNSFLYIVGFDIDPLTGDYYIADNSGNKIIVFDSNWNYLKTLSTPAPTCIKTVNNYLYICQDNALIKTSMNLVLLVTYPSPNALFYDVYYATDTGLLYLPNYGLKKLDVLDTNLSFKRAINFGSYSPYTITGNNNNKLYVSATYSGGFYLIGLFNETIIYYSQTLCSSSITGILLDMYDRMAISCFTNMRIYQFHINGTYLNRMMVPSENFLTRMTYNLMKQVVLLGSIKVLVLN